MTLLEALYKRAPLEIKSAEGWHPVSDEKMNVNIHGGDFALNDQIDGETLRFYKAEEVLFDARDYAKIMVFGGTLLNKKTKRLCPILAVDLSENTVTIRIEGGKRRRFTLANVYKHFTTHTGRPLSRTKPHDA